jgi:hypothetical protein
VAHPQQVFSHTTPPLSLKTSILFCIPTHHHSLKQSSVTAPVLAAAAAALGNLGYHHDINRCSIVDLGGTVMVMALTMLLLLLLHQQLFSCGNHDIHSLHLRHRSARGMLRVRMP